MRVARLNWAGLGVSEPLAPPEGAALAAARGSEPRGDRCVPLSRVGETLEVLWRLDGRGRVVGERLAPPRGGWEEVGCAQALRCPGCVTRHLSADEQRAVITESHLAAIARLSGRDLSGLPVEWAPSPPPDGYRARLSAQLFEGEGERGALTGGMWARWGEQIDLARCPVQTSGGRLLLSRALTALAARPQVAVCVERVTTQAMGEEASGLVVLHVKQPPPTSASAEPSAELSPAALDEELRDLLRLALLGSAVYVARRAQPKGDAVLTHLLGPEEVTWTCDDGITLRGAPPSWLPQSPSSVTALRAAALAGLGAGRGARVFEVGCGVGVVSLWLARRGLDVYGVDIEPAAVVGAQRALALNEPLMLPPRFEAVDGRRGLATYSAREGAPGALLVHAMRAPIPGLLTLAAHLGVRSVCYLAPSAPSLGRELAEEPRYALLGLTLLHQTPGSAQAMCVARLSLVEGEER